MLPGHSISTGTLGESLRGAACSTLLAAHDWCEGSEWWVRVLTGDQTVLAKLSSLPHTCRKGRKTVIFTYGCNYYSNWPGVSVRPHWTKGAVPNRTVHFRCHHTSGQ